LKKLGFSFSLRMDRLVNTITAFFFYLPIWSSAVERRWAADWRLSEWKSDLDGCYHVYIDVGSNRGIQVRKLYEPMKYPGSKVHKLFDKYFGLPTERNLSEICTVGFEADPRYRMELRLIRSNYENMVWPVNFVFSAVSDGGTKGKVTLRTSGKTVEDWRSSTNPDYHMNDEGRKYDVNVVRLSDYINTHVARRLLPRPIVFDMPPRAIMKIDIAGSEGTVVHDLIQTNALLKISALYIRWHDKHVTPERRFTIVQARNELSVFRSMNKDRNIQSFNDDIHSFSNMNFPKTNLSKP